MWFMNSIINPFTRLVLRSPLHGWMSASLLLITVFGRKSRRRITLPVNYVQSGETIFILPGMPERKTWWKNLLGGAEVEVLLRGQVCKGVGEVVQGSENTQAVADALHLYFQRFPASASYRKVRRNADGTFDAGDIQRAASQTMMVRVKLTD